MDGSTDTGWFLYRAGVKVDGWGVGWGENWDSFADNDPCVTDEGEVATA